MQYHSKILIADDDPITRESLNALLVNDIYTVRFAANGQEALEEAYDWGPDLVLLDVMMPGMDGFTVCQHLRQNPETAEVPILLITALDDQESHLRGINVGADDFISKPFNRTVLRARIGAIIRLNRYRRLLVERIKFERVVDHANTGFLLINDQGRISFVNPLARIYLGLSENDTLEMIPFTLLVKQRYQQQPETAWHNWPQRPSNGESRYLVQPETDSARDFWLHVETLDQLTMGDETLWIISLTDVTTQLSSLRDARHFHALISHKLRTPLTSIVSGLEILTSMNWDEARAKEVAQIALLGSKQLKSEINQIIRFLDVPQLLAEFNMGFPLAEFTAVLTKLCTEMQIQLNTLKVDLPENGTLVLTAPVIETILQELLSNAQKFHPASQPSIDITAYISKEAHCCLQVSDDGLTLSTEQLAQVWQPYYQGDKYFTGQIEGMGLGLAMVSSFVWGVGGRCHISNRTQQPGITVELIIPMVKHNEQNKR